MNEIFLQLVFYVSYISIQTSKVVIPFFPYCPFSFPGGFGAVFRTCSICLFTSWLRLCLMMFSLLCVRWTLFLQVFLPPQCEAAVLAKSCVLATPSCPHADFCPSICPQLEVLGRAILAPPAIDPSKGLPLSFPGAHLIGEVFLRV